MKSNYDVFISYRREGGYETAQAVKLSLERKGYCVFLDVETLRNGPFNEALYAVVKSTPHFLVVLSPGALDRCFQPEDWVYQEISQAFKTRRNVVPIMLRGFVWPKEAPASSDDANGSPEDAAQESERLRSVAETLQKLSNQNGIAPSPEHFSDSMKRLTTLTPIGWRRSLRPFRTRFFIGATLLAAAIGFFAFCRYSAEQKKFEIASKEVANLSTLPIVQFDALIQGLAVVDEGWTLFIKKTRAEPEKVDVFAEELCQTINWQARLIDKYYSADIRARPSAAAMEVLRERSVDASDVDALFETITPQFQEDCRCYLESVRDQYLQYAVAEPKALDIYESTGTKHFQILKLNAKVFYIGYLSLLKELSPSVYDDVRNILEKTTIGVDVPARQSLDDLTTQMKKTQEEQKRLLQSLDADLKAAEAELTKKETDLNEIVLDVETDEEAKNDDLRRRVDELTTQAAASANKIEETFLAIKEKHKILPTDSLGEGWGKTLRIASVLRLRLQTLGAPQTDVAEDVCRWIDVWEMRWRDEGAHVSRCAESARAFFRALGAGEIEDCGRIVYLIENDAKHPDLEVGDVVLSINGVPARTEDDWPKNAKSDGGNKIERLRFENGRPTTTEYVSQKGAPRVAYLDLTE